MLWLVDSLYQIYSYIAFTHCLANLMLLLLIVLLVVLIGAVVYVLMIQGAESDRGGQRRRHPKSQRLKPKRQRNAAELRQQMEQIQDEVSRQALLSRSRRLKQT